MTTIYALFTRAILLGTGGERMTCSPMPGFGPYDSEAACEFNRTRLPPNHSDEDFRAGKSVKLVCMSKIEPTWQPTR
jgi:hypothetical protein